MRARKIIILLLVLLDTITHLRYVGITGCANFTL